MPATAGAAGNIATEIQTVMLTISASQACPIYKEEVFPRGMTKETLHINTHLASAEHCTVGYGM